jgi:hypothetical protein
MASRADPGEPGVDDGLSEVGVLGEEPVPGMHRVRPGPRRSIEQLGLVQVALRRGGATERERLVGEPHERGVTVVVGVDGHAAQARVAACPDHPDGDLAPVGDEHGPQGGRGVLRHRCLQDRLRPDTVARGV